MKKSIMILITVTAVIFCAGQNSKPGTDSVYTGNSDSTRSYSSPQHNILHEFTYLVAMRDYCDKTLSQMRADGEVNKKLSKKLKRELVNTKAELASSKYNGLKIESGVYEVFLKQINDRFKN